LGTDVRQCMAQPVEPLPHRDAKAADLIDDRGPLRTWVLPDFWETRVGLNVLWPDADFLQRLHLCPLLGAMRTRFARPELFRV
jgi:hypothetical protein